MNLTKHHKLMVLYISESNPFWKRVRQFETSRHVDAIDERDVIDMTGLCRETIKNWRLGKPMRPSKGSEVFRYTLDHLKACIKRARDCGRANEDEYDALQAVVRVCAQAFDTGHIDLYAIAIALGMSVSTCQRILDSAMYEARPLLRSVYLPPAPKEIRVRDYAQIEAEKYVGVYLLWAQIDGVWMQCPMSIRYLQEVREGRFLRCKMNVPSLCRTDTEGKAYLQYDGFAVASEKKLFCTFERRQHGCVDLFHVVTDVPDNLGVESITLGGIYLTTQQDETQSIATGKVLLRRTSKEMSDPRHTYYRDLMATGAIWLTSRVDVGEMDIRWSQYARVPEDFSAHALRGLGLRLG